MCWGDTLTQLFTLYADRKKGFEICLFFVPWELTKTNGLFTLYEILFSVPFSDAFFVTFYSRIWVTQIDIQRSRILAKLCQKVLSTKSFSLFCVSCVVMFLVQNLAHTMCREFVTFNSKISLAPRILGKNFVPKNWQKSVIKRHRKKQNFVLCKHTINN